MTTAPTKTMNGKSIMPSLTVDDLDRSLSFFTGLGFEVEDRWEQDGKLLGVMLKAGNTASASARTTARRGPTG